MNPVAAASFEAAVAEHGPLVRRICRGILVDGHASDDAAQDAFLRLWTSLSSGEGPHSVGPWLRRAAASASIDVLRRRREIPQSSSRVDEDVEELEPPARPVASPDARLHAQSLANAIERAVTTLSPTQRAVFVLRHEAAIPLVEVAHLLDLSPSTAKTHFARATLRLRTELVAYGPRGVLS